MTDNSQLKQWLLDGREPIESVIAIAFWREISKRYWESPEGQAEERRLLYGDPDAKNPPPGILKA